MSIGDNIFGAVSFDLSILLKMHGVPIPVTRYDQSATASQRDIYGNPNEAPNNFTTQLLFGGIELDEQETIGGGKAKEVLIMIGQPGTIKENDILSYNDHNYDVRHVGKAVMGGLDALEAYTATREVDM